jgi:hypothetical protein
MRDRRTRQEEADRVAGRVRTLSQWSTAPVGELLRILEIGNYRFPMRRDFDSRLLLEHLWDVHRDELTDEPQARLYALIGSPVLSQRASDQCDAYLLALRGARDEIERLWRSGHSKFPEDSTFSKISHRVLLDCICHVQVGDRAIIEGLIDDLGKDTWLFLPRFETMLALGKLKAARGTRAAQVIKRSIYDSTAAVINARERVLARLMTDPGSWERCTNCCHGRVRGDSCTSGDCPICLGLGSVQSVANR